MAAVRTATSPSRRSGERERVKCARAFMPLRFARAARCPPGYLDCGGMLELVDLHRSFGGVRALDGLSFAVPPGSLFGLVGRNGAGKTTAMRAVCGIAHPDGGEVRWRGRPMDAEARRRTGYLPEERGLYQRMRAAEQLEYLARLHGIARVEAAASSRRWLDRLGLAERADDPVERLSLG